MFFLYTGAFKKKATNSPSLTSSSIKQNYESTSKISTPNSPISTRQSSLSTSKISTSTLPTTNQTQLVSNSPPVASSSTTSISNSASIASSSNLLAIDSPAATPRDYAADLDEAPCRECGELVSAYDLPEHLDFHFAQVHVLTLTILFNYKIRYGGSNTRTSYVPMLFIDKLVYLLCPRIFILLLLGTMP